MDKDYLYGVSLAAEGHGKKTVVTPRQMMLSRNVISWEEARAILEKCMMEEKEFSLSGVRTIYGND